MSSLRKKHYFPNDFHVGLYADCAWGTLSNTELKKTENISAKWMLYLALCCVVTTLMPMPI